MLLKPNLVEFVPGAVIHTQAEVLAAAVALFESLGAREIMIGEGPGMDGKVTTWRSVSRMPDNDTVEMSMYVGGGTDPMFTIAYRRKK